MGDGDGSDQDESQEDSDHAQRDIAKRLVELMGGTIGMENTPGKGSSFWFTLPVSDRRPSASGSTTRFVAAGGRPLVSSPLLGRGLRVLVAEDNLTNPSS